MMELKVGDKIPNFSAKDSQGNHFNSSSVVGKRPVVVYFYPKDETRVCTQQACSFRDRYEEFSDLGAEVIGISSDSVGSHQQFSNRYNLPFVLLSDPDKKIRKLFGVANDWFGLLPGRTTYVADKSGTIIMVFDSTNGVQHIEKGLAALKNI